MKPRIRLIGGFWRCTSFEPRNDCDGTWLYPVRGDGYTPLEAYRDWQAQVNA